MSLISIVVPVYNNASSLVDLLSSLREVAENNPTDDFEFVFVDDGSIDNSHQILVTCAKNDPSIQVIKLSRNFGSNAALLAGISQSHGNAVAAIAADLQDPPELINDMLAAWHAGNKVVLAARKSRDDEFIITFLADTFYILFRRFAIKTMPKHGFDFFLIDRQVCDLINSIQENNAYLMGLILWTGFNPKIFYYHRRARDKRYGRSMWTITKKIKYFLDSFVAFSYFPIRVASIIGITLSCLGILYALSIIILRLAFAIRIEGWSSLMIILLVVSGVQMTMIGILGEYIWRNLDETRKRPRYIIESRIGSSDSSHENTE